MAARPPAAFAGQAVRPRLVIDTGLGPQGPRPGHPARDRHRHPGPLPGTFRSPHRVMTAPAFVLKTKRLRAARGVTVAVDVALTASPGEVIAVEGPNGSGKTTLLTAAAGLLPAGNPTVRPASVGYAPERASVLPRMPVSRWLLGLARTAGLSRRESAVRTSDVLDRLGLASAASRPVNVLSRGNTQRALVAQALVGD